MADNIFECGKMVKGKRKYLLGLQTKMKTKIERMEVKKKQKNKIEVNQLGMQNPCLYALETHYC